MGSVEQPCSRCGRDNAEEIGQSVIDGQLRSYRSGRCLACGPFEEDDVGMPPEAWRQLLMAANGCHELHIEPRYRVGAARLLRAALGLTLQQVATILAGLPVVYRGTRAEVEWLHGLAERMAVPASMR